MKSARPKAVYGWAIWTPRYSKYYPVRDKIPSIFETRASAQSCALRRFNVVVKVRISVVSRKGAR